MNGTPTVMVGKSAPRNPKKMIWTSSGVPRKTQMNSHATARSTGLADSRITASTAPPTTPNAIATAVRPSVTSTPCSTKSLNR